MIITACCLVAATELGLDLVSRIGYAHVFKLLSVVIVSCCGFRAMHYMMMMMLHFAPDVCPHF